MRAEAGADARMYVKQLCRAIKYSYGQLESVRETENDAPKGDDSDCDPVPRLVLLAIEAAGDQDDGDHLCALCEALARVAHVLERLVLARAREKVACRHGAVGRERVVWPHLCPERRRACRTALIVVLAGLSMAVAAIAPLKGDDGQRGRDRKETIDEDEQAAAREPLALRSCASRAAGRSAQPARGSAASDNACTHRIQT